MSRQKEGGCQGGGMEEGRWVNEGKWNGSKKEQTCLSPFVSQLLRWFFQLCLQIYTQICNLPFLCGVVTTLKILGSEALPDFDFLLFSSAIFHFYSCCMPLGSNVLSSPSQNRSILPPGLQTNNSMTTTKTMLCYCLFDEAQREKFCEGGERQHIATKK